MKSLISPIVKVLVAIFVFYMVCAHLTHESALGGYRQGCKDVILDVTSRSGHDIDEGIVTDYCNELSNQYEKKK